MFRVHGLGVKGFRVQGLGFRVWGLGFPLTLKPKTLGAGTQFLLLNPTTLKPKNR